MKKNAILLFLLTFLAIYSHAQSVSIATPSPEYIAENGGVQTFAVTLSSAQTYSVSVNYTIVGNYAQAGTDYTASSGTFVFAPGQTTKTISVTIIDDYMNEPTEYYYIELTNAINVNTSAPFTIASYYAYGYINDNDPTISIANTSLPVAEANGVQTFSVSLSAAQAYSVTVNYSTFNAGAIAGSDYVATNGILTFAPGETTKTFTVNILNDFLAETDEAYYAEITNALNITANQPMYIANQYSYAIINDDDPTVDIAVNASPDYVTESMTTQTFTVTLSAAQTYPVSVNYTTQNAGATAGTDYVATSGTLTFLPGQIIKTITVNILDDYLNEYTEGYYMYLSDAQNATTLQPMSIYNSYGYAYINDNDPTLSIDTYSSPDYITEGTGTQTFTVILSAAQTYSVSVNYETINASATAGQDYVVASGTLVFAPGQTTKTISVSILDDFMGESTEVYYIQLSNPQNVNASLPVTMNNSYSYAYINDNDPTMSISSSGSPDYIPEGTGTQTFTVTLSAAQTYSVSVDYTTSNGSAVDGSDYVSTSGTLVFTPGQTSKTITVNILNDYLNESAEYYYVILSNFMHVASSQPMTLGNTYSYAYINDNDPIINISGIASPDYMNEIGGIQTYTVTLSAAQTYSVSVSYSTSNGSAQSGSDYAENTGILTFAPGDTSKIISVNAINDYIYEGAEYYYISISNPQNANALQPMTLSTSTGYGYINDDDPTISINTASPEYVSENAGTQLFTVTLSAPQTYTTSVDYILNPGSAQPGSDFTFGICALTLNFAPGETTKIFSASIIDDGLSESTEYYYTTISNARNADVSMPMTILNYYSYAYINDNDNAGCGVNVLNRPVISGSTLYCPGTQLNLSVANLAGATGYVWNGPNGFTASGQNISISNVSSIHSGIYTARAYRAGGTVCDTSVGANVSVSVLPCASTVSLKVYIEGYYVDSGRMTTKLLNHGLSSSTIDADSIDIELHQATSPYALVASVRSALNTNGTAIATYPSINGTYYIALKHSSAVQTWSATPVVIGASPTSYDFTNLASKAYGNNMKEVEPGIWAIYSGDIVQDENVDLIDLTELEGRINSFDSCYLPADLNGDGNTDLLDSPILENNINNFIYSTHP